jgi:16S rRNA (cytidine1402-2'-O)-methyltransferase
VQVVAAEDTRVGRKLLSLCGITGPQVIAFHQHSGAREFTAVVKTLEEGKDVALITDAGTPAIADPGSLLVAHVVEKCPSVSIVPIPGVCAATTALSVSGFPADQFTFIGFPPHKGRDAFFKMCAEVSSERTTVLYESPHRILKTIADVARFCDPTQKIMIGRELTKQFETIYRTTVSELPSLDIKEKGEFVLVICRKTTT